MYQISSKKFGNGTESIIECKVPNFQIFNGGVQPYVYLNIMYNDLDHISN
jgi:hypothetical protein